jgi:Arm DNA-binding domain
MALTNTAVKNARPKAKPYKLGDGGGLYLLVQPNGRKLWRMISEKGEYGAQGQLSGNAG